MLGETGSEQEVVWGVWPVLEVQELVVEEVPEVTDLEPEAVLEVAWALRLEEPEDTVQVLVEPEVVV
mgnify:CR=1 FL=1